MEGGLDARMWEDQRKNMGQALLVTSVDRVLCAYLRTLPSTDHRTRSIAANTAARALHVGSSSDRIVRQPDGPQSDGAG